MEFLRKGKKREMPKKKVTKVDSSFYKPIQAMQNQLNAFAAFHGQFTKSLQSHEISITEGLNLAEKMKELSEVPHTNSILTVLLKQAAQWEQSLETARLNLNKLISRQILDALLPHYTAVQKQSAAFDKAKLAYEAAELRLKQYNRGSKLNLIKHVELEQDCDARARELLAQFQQLSLLKDGFDNLCMEKLLVFIDSWHRLVLSSKQTLEEISTQLAPHRVQQAKFGQDFEAFNKVKLRDLNPQAREGETTFTPQVGVIDDDSAELNIKQSLDLKVSNLNVIPPLASPTSTSPPHFSPMHSPSTSPRQILSDEEKCPSSPPHSQTESNSIQAPTKGHVSVVSAKQKRFSLHALTPTYGTISPFFLTKTGFFSDEEDEEAWGDERPVAMRHSITTYFGDIPNVFDARKVGRRLGKGQPYIITVNLEASCIIFKKKNSAKEILRKASSVLQLIKSRSRRRQLAVVWFVEMDEKQGESSCGELLEHYLFASILERERFYEVCSWAPMIANLEGNAAFLTTEELSVFVASWNFNISLELGKSAKFLLVPEILHSFIPKVDRPHDIIVIGFQESGVDFFDMILTHLGTHYIKLITKHTGNNVRMGVFVLRKHFHKLSHVESTQDARAIAVALNFNETSMAFVNCQFPYQNSCDARNRCWRSVLKDITFKHSSFDLTNQFDHLFVLGDFNYPINLTSEPIMDGIAKKDWKNLSSADELTRERLGNNAFTEFQEGPLIFPPTYPFIPATHNYNATEKPCWSDRILWKSAPGISDRIVQNCYSCCTDMELTTDHAPIYSIFTLNTFLPNVPHKDSQCHFVITKLSIKKALQSISDKAQKSLFVEFENSNLLHTPVFTPPIALEFTSNNEHVYFGNKEDKIALELITTNWEYLENQHFFVAVRSVDDPMDNNFAQTRIACKGANSPEGASFQSLLTIKGKVMGVLSGRITFIKDKVKDEKPQPLLRAEEANLTNVRKILNNPSSFAIFEEYLKSQFADENLEFWSAIQKWREVENKQTKAEMAQDIFRRFFTTSCDLEINIEAEMKREVQDKLEEDPTDPHVFDDSEFFVLRMLAETNYPKFQLSEKSQHPIIQHALYFS